VERGQIGVGNWDALIALFKAMGTHDNPFPCHNNHDRARLDGDAVIYESLFDPDEVSIEAFKQLLADEFAILVEDIEHTTAQDDYAGHGTTVWTFLYNAVVRLAVRRFGRGGTWQESGDECRGYLVLYRDEWETEQL